MEGYLVQPRYWGWGTLVLPQVMQQSLLTSPPRGRPHSFWRVDGLEWGEGGGMGEGPGISM